MGWYQAVRDPFRTILGVRFYVCDLDGLLERLPHSGLVVAPSAPVMVRLAEDPEHRRAMEGADFAITDSSLMVLLWLFRTGERIRRISGLRLLRGLFERGLFAGKGESLWVMPSPGDAAATLGWLATQGFSVASDDVYVAPMYPRSDSISDPVLLEMIRRRRPRLVVIALSGGVQERLGWHVAQGVDRKVPILCIGGAIAFLTGRQTPIPVWADRLALGWLFRWVADPRGFSAKVRGVGRLPSLIWRHGASSVVLDAR